MALSAEEREQIRQLVKNGKRNQARSLLYQAIRNDPEDAAAWHGLSQLMNDPKNKIEYLRKAAELAPDNQVIKEQLEELEQSTKPVKRKTAWWVWLLLALTAPILACMCYGMIAAALDLPLPSTSTIAPTEALVLIETIALPPTWTHTVPPPLAQEIVTTPVPTETPVWNLSYRSFTRIGRSHRSQQLTIQTFALPECISPQTPQIGQVDRRC